MQLRNRSNLKRRNFSQKPFRKAKEPFPQPIKARIEIDDCNINVGKSKKVKDMPEKNFKNQKSQVIVSLSRFVDNKCSNNPFNSHLETISEHKNDIANNVRKSSRLRISKQSSNFEILTIESEEEGFPHKKHKLTTSKLELEKRKIEEKIVISLPKPIKAFPPKVDEEDIRILTEKLQSNLKNNPNFIDSQQFSAINFKFDFKSLENFNQPISQNFKIPKEENIACWKFFDSKFPLKISAFPEKKSIEVDSEDFVNISIIDNENQKLQINVHKYFISTKNIEKVTNPFCKERRAEFYKTCSFTEDFKSGYTPIDLQANENSQAERMHFIRKKQSCANVSLKRTGGVSYVKPTESKQLHVNHIYEPLSHLVFQCSTGCEILEQHIPQLEKISKSLLLNSSILATYFESDDEEIMRNYILKPHERLKISKGKYFVLKTFTDLWPLFHDHFFICLHFKFHPKFLIQNFDIWLSENYKGENVDKTKIKEFVFQSDIMIGILVRKSISGKKAFSKSIIPDFDPKNIPENFQFVSPKSVSTKMSYSHSIDAADKVLNLDGKDSISTRLFGNSDFQSLPCYSEIISQISNYFDSNDFETNRDRFLKPEIVPKTSNESVNNDCITISSDESKSTHELMNSKKLDYLKRLWKEPGKNINTLSLRYEIYVEKEKWEESTAECKNVITTFAQVSKDCLEEFIVDMIEFREKAKSDICVFKDSFKKFNCIDVGTDLGPFLKEEKLWNLSFPLEICQNENLLFNHNKNLFSTELKTFFNEIPTSTFSLPLYFISIRDCFAFDLREKVTILKMGKQSVIKREFFFHPNALPQNFVHFKEKFPDLRVGVTTYENFFTHEQLKEIESETHDTELKCFSGHFLPMTCQTTCTSEKVRRTKFFFGVRYMWSRLQLAEPHSNISAGVRKDVSPPPPWMKHLVEYPLVREGIIEKDFVNSITMNIYHDGKEGLAQHFDDAVRFKQVTFIIKPIFTVRLFSDCRLSFGSQLYGFCNGAFTIPLPRGCVCVMEEGSYSANGIKHCIRPCDMSGKSAAIILRQIHERVLVKSFNSGRRSEI